VRKNSFAEILAIGPGSMFLFVAQRSARAAAADLAGVGTLLGKPGCLTIVESDVSY